MLGYLVPCAGGKSIVLSRPTLYLGRRADADREAPLSVQTAVCRLRFVGRWWHIDNLNLQSSTGLQVNGQRCTSQRLLRGDELVVGRSRYRIDYTPPEDASDRLEQIAESVLFGDQRLEPTARGKMTSFTSPVLVASKPVLAAGPVSDQAVQSGSVRIAVAKPSASVELRELLGRLVPLGGGADYPLVKRKVTVGRLPPCDVILRVKTVSSKHCALELIEGYWQVTDLGSHNGVRLDSVRCPQAWVFPDSRLSVADQRFRLDYTPEGEPPTPHPSQQPSLLAKVGLTGASLERLVGQQNRLGKQDAEQEPKRWDLSEDE